jgi:glucosamine--fructose-6-phosphate aminotransferase (isomerizing)
MCGLFGLARPTDAHAADTRAGTRALLMLGAMAEERGVDASGLAYWPTSRPDDERPDGRADAAVDGWRVAKRVGAFGELSLRGKRAELNNARIVLGHTRHATQGDVRRLVNASPLTAGPLLGTHNGDVTSEVLRRRHPRLDPVGETDSELLFGALAGAHDVPAMVEVLAALEGRAALAWVDRRTPSRLWLARAALSPLAVSVTDDGQLLWASNPDWLRRVSRDCGLAVRAGSPALVPEGTLLAFDVGAKVRYLGSRQFVPRPRIGDLALTWAIWRGFGQADRAADQAGLCSLAALVPAPAAEAA